MKSLGVDLVFMKAQSTVSALIECVSAIGATKVVYNQLYGMYCLLCFLCLLFRGFDITNMQF